MCARIALSDANGYGSVFFESGMSLSLALTKRRSFNSNASGRFTSSTYGRDKALIWNAQTAYRLTKGKNIELKPALNDLLRQNRSLYFQNGETGFTSGHRNSLTQYLMLSPAYYPKKVREELIRSNVCFRSAYPSRTGTKPLILEARRDLDMRRDARPFVPPNPSLISYLCVLQKRKKKCIPRSSESVRTLPTKRK